MSTTENVRIYTDSNLSTYIDVTCRLARRCRIHEVENYGATAEFTIVNDLYSSSYNVLSSSFYRLHNPSTGGYSRWSDNGTRAITTGMFVQIRDGSSSGSCWGTFMITGISASDDLVTFTCGDYIQLLRATGAEYYRNHYESGGQVTERVEADLSTNGIAIDRPNGVTLVGGAAGDVKYMVPDNEDYKNTQTNVSGGYGVSSTIHLASTAGQYRTDGYVGIEYIKVNLRSLNDGFGAATVHYTIRLYGVRNSQSTLLYTWNVNTTSTVNSEFTLSLSSALDLTSYTDIRVEINGEYTSSYDTYSYVGTYRSYETGISCSTTFGSNTYDGYCLYCSIGWLTYKNAAGNNTTDSYNNPVFEITSIDTVSTIDSSLLTYGFKRALITYQDPNANMNKMTIAANILLASGAICNAVWSDKEVNMFRCGGDCYHNYLLALMDMEDSEGDMHAMAAVPTSWAYVWIGRRYKASDSYQKTLYYAGGSTYTGIAMKSFSPHITKSGRPALAVAKGKRNDGTPIIVAVKDPNIAIGSSVSVLGSSESSSVDAAFNAYSQIITNRSTDWEGEVVLSGIYMDFFSRSGNNVGGIPVRIYDSRYGMSAYRAKVKECTVDYQELTTTLVLNNYSELYSNAVLDTSKMAYEAGNMSAVATAVELYTRQYVFVDSGQSLPSTSTYTMSIQLTTGDTMTVEADVIKYPELGVATVIGYFPEGSPYTSSQYAVYRVRVNSGSWILIDSHMRPDKHISQYVIVNVQMNL